MNRIHRLLAALLLALAAAACGPGVGGSGTGAVPDPLAAQGATPAALCDSLLAGALGCRPPPASPTAAPVLDLPAILIDHPSPRRAQAVVAGEEVLLDLACPTALRFEGRWGRGGDGIARFYGRLEDGRLASAELQLDGTSWLLSLRDADGRLLAGPLRLQRTEAVAPLLPCS